MSRSKKLVWKTYLTGTSFLHILRNRPLICRKKPTFANVNCWFCNQNTVVPYGNRNCWDCPNCDQYNGFQEVGFTKIRHLLMMFFLFDVFIVYMYIFMCWICFGFRMGITTSPSQLSTWNIWTTECPVPFPLLRHPRWCSMSTVRCCCARSATTTRL